MTPAPFQRLIGLETEYAPFFHQVAPHRAGSLPTLREVFDVFAAALSRRLPTAEGEFLYTHKASVFLANGGAVCFETVNPASGSGFIEGATPECRSPRDAVAWQRAQDALFAEAAAEAGQRFNLDLRLLKNCRDALGHSYGAQESYDVLLARGWRLWAWRFGILLGLPLTFVLRIAAEVLALLIVVANLVIAVPVYWLGRPRDPLQRKRWFVTCFGRFWVTNREVDAVWSRWLDVVIIHLLARLTFGVAGAYISFWFSLTHARRLQRRILPFVVTRMVFAGAGRVVEGEPLHLSDKATSRNLDFAALPVPGWHAIYSLGAILKAFMGWLMSRDRLRELWRPRTRLQIGIGDSNLCEQAEYLRLGTTWLMIEAGEAGALEHLPLLQSPLEAMRTYDADPTLQARAPLVGGGTASALEIQRACCEACTRFLKGMKGVPAEAWEIAGLWYDVLQRLETDRGSLVGRVDWITKEYLLNQLGPQPSYPELKKVDLRYHELHAEGYFSQLQAAGATVAVVHPEEIDRARRIGPPNSPAARRARFIREHSGAEPLVVSWNRLLVGRPPRVQEVRFGMREE